MTEPLFFMQDNRQMVGDCIMWWGEGGNGYVTDIGRAKRFTLKEAVSQNLEIDPHGGHAAIPPEQRIHPGSVERSAR